MLLSEYAAVSQREELLTQWDAERNQALSPQKVQSGSDRKVWWQCGKGHRWSSTVSSRAILGRGCPYCAGQRVLRGENDLASRYPEVTRFWHPTANGDVTPETVMPGTHRKFHWLCEKGHSWQAPPGTLIGGSGCPCCSGRQAIPGETDLATTHPQLAEEWHGEKNGKLTPRDVTAGSEKRVWWKCRRGHDYAAVVFSRTEGSGCPYCAGRKAWPGFNDLESQFSGLMREWHEELNNGVDPKTLTKGSHRAVWWQCGEGHVWRAVVYSRTRENGTGCPVCAGNAKRTKAQHINV